MSKEIDFDNFIYKVYPASWFKRFPEAVTLLEEFLAMCFRLQRCPQPKELVAEYGKSWLSKFRRYFGTSTSVVYAKMGLVFKGDRAFLNFSLFCLNNDRIPGPDDQIEDFVCGQPFPSRSTYLESLCKSNGIDYLKVKPFLRQYRSVLNN